MFKVGDRVEAVEPSGWDNYLKGDKGTVTAVDGGHSRQPIEVKFDSGKSCWPLVANVKLITEEPMNVITALEKSITHWQEIVAVFGGAKAGDDREHPHADNSNCPLCEMIGNKCSLAKGRCANCPMKSCGEGSLYYAVYEATTNAAAYTASKAMLARLEELLVEEQGKAKKEEAAIRVGDIVIGDASANIKAEWVREILEINGTMATVRTSGGTTLVYPVGIYTLIYRPTKEAK